MPPGDAPDTPTDGDVWTQTDGVYVRLGGRVSQLDTVAGTYTLRTDPARALGVAPWPYSDLVHKRRRYGTELEPLAPSVPGNAFWTPEMLECYAGGARRGGVQCALDLLQIRSAQASDANRNYVARQTFASAVTTDGGTSSASYTTAKGGLFGLSSIAVLYGGATNWLNVTAAEFDTNLARGSSVWYKSVIQLNGVHGDAVQGTVHDTMLGMSRTTDAIGFRNAILVGGMSGGFPLSATGCVLCTDGAGVFANGIKLSGQRITGNAYESPGFAVDGSGNLTGSTARLSVRTVAALPRCDHGADGMLAYVNDAVAPTYNGAVTGGGSVRTLALCNGTVWTAH